MGGGLCNEESVSKMEKMVVFREPLICPWSGELIYLSPEGIYLGSEASAVTQSPLRLALDCRQLQTN